MAIKTKISKVYAKAKDRNYTHVYKEGKRLDSSISCENKFTHFCSGRPALRNGAVPKIKLYCLDQRQVPSKNYEVLRLCILKKISLAHPGITKRDYSLRFEKYTHQLLRFHAIASGARADRLSRGMKESFGKVFTRATKVKPHDLFLQICFSEKYSSRPQIDTFIKQLNRLRSKFNFQYYLKIQDPV